MNIGCSVIALGFFYMLGFALLFCGLRNAQRSTEAASWPATPGTLTHLTEHTAPSEEGDDAYAVKVRYIYSVAGKAYEGSCLAFGYMATSNHDVHAAIYQKLKEAKTIDVRYDPSDPGQCWLSYGVHRSIQITLVFASFLLIVVTCFALLSILFAREDHVLLDHLQVR